MAGGSGLGPPKLQAESLRSKVESTVRGWVVTGHLVPGTNYTIRGVADELGVSATPVREAVMRLASDGLLKVSRNKGFQVVELTEDTLNEILFMRLLLEVGALQRLAGRLRPERHEYFKSLVDQMFTLAKPSQDVTEYLAVSREFHVGLVAELGMPRLTDAVINLRDSARISAVSRPDRLEEGNREHSEILAAIADGDASRTREVMIRHLVHHRGSWVDLDDDAHLFESFMPTSPDASLAPLGDRHSPS